MPERETLQRILNDPHSTEEERSEAQRLIDARNANSHEQRLRLTGIATIAGVEPDLLTFAGATRLCEVTPFAVVEFLASQPQPLPEVIKTLVAIWTMFRGSVTDEVWRDIKARFPEEERHAEFQRIITAHPYFGCRSTFWRDQVRHVREFCSQNDDYTVRTYFLSRVEQLLQQLPEYEFELREATQALLARYRNQGN